jgi:hypothetical protein
MTDTDRLAAALHASIQPVCVHSHDDRPCPVAAAILRADPTIAADLARPPEHTRLILASEDLLESWGTRTEDGRRITAEWGEPDEHGWYTPIFTATDDGMAVGLAADLALADAVREVVDRYRTESGRNRVGLIGRGHDGAVELIRDIDAAIEEALR